MSAPSFPVPPMKAVPGELPAKDDDWAYEVKWDGMRALVFISEGEVRLQSSNSLDITASFPELAGLARAVGGADAVLDGEIVATDDAGRPNFGQLQKRMHVADPLRAAQLASTVPVSFLAFDLLGVGDTPAMELPYVDRRRLLERLVEPGQWWRVPPHQVGGGAALATWTKDQKLEGIIAKRLDSTYQPGKRSTAWRKIKHRLHQEFVVGGWTTGTGHRQTSLGALLLGYYEGTALRYAGRVGTGFTDGELARLTTRLGPLSRLTVPAVPFSPPPPRDHAVGATWVEPEMVVEVAFAEWTNDTLLRHPSYLGERTDKAASEVTRDP